MSCLVVITIPQQVVVMQSDASLSGIKCGSVHLQCIQTDDGQARCNGALTIDDACPQRARCQVCGTGYDVCNGVPVLKESIDEALDNGLEGQVYARQSRNASLSGEGCYLEQSQVLWNYLPEFCERNGIEGPCLEVGCGIGIFAQRVPEYVGLDYSLNALLAEGFEDYDRVCASGHCLPFQDAQFQLIFSLNTYEHVPKLDEAFRELDRVLKPSGYVILKPAWNCCQYNCDGVGHFPYSQLSVRNRVIKRALPLLRARLYKLMTRVPPRIFYEFLALRPHRLRYRELRPRFDLFCKVADAEAFSSVDPFHAIRWFRSHGYTCLSHSSAVRRVLAGHDIVVMQKDAA